MDRAELVRSVGKRVGVTVVVENIVGGVVVFAYLMLVLAPPPADPEPASIWVDVAIFAGVVALLLPLGWWWGRRTFVRGCCWIEENRPPTDAERAGALAQPLRQAAQPLAFWAFAAVAYGIGGHLNEHTFAHTIKTVDGIVLGGIATAALTYLLVERACRPVFAVVLAGEPPERPSSLGIRPRLLLAWAVGSGVPLLALVVTPLAYEEHAQHDLTMAVVVMALVGLEAGAMSTILVARSLAEPLDAVRRSLLQVQGGDLDVAVSVDDAGEVGLLQSGVNRMVAGLRERQRLQDLFGRHVGEDVARLALEGGAPGLGGEQREVSTLFVDLVGSTALAQDRPPHEVVSLLNAFFAAVVAAVGDEGGWVNKFEGDGALCVFGAPVDQPDHAARALRAARSLRAALEALALVHPGLDAGIGVSTGSVVAGNVGTESRYEYTVIGDPVNEAARLTDEAKGRASRLLAGEATIAAAGDEADQWVPAGAVALRGRSGRTSVFEPAAIDLAQGADASALRARSTPASSTS